MTGALIKERQGDIGEMLAQRRRPCDKRGRKSRSDGSASRGTSGSHRKLGESQRKDPPRGQAALCHLDFQLLAGRTVRRCFPIALSPPPPRFVVLREAVPGLQ